MIKVLIVDNQQVIREGLSGLLAYHAGLEVVGQASDGLRACSMVQELRPDVVLMDIRMPGCDGIAATEIILRDNRDVKVLILTTFDEDDLIVKAMKAGASGYLLKDANSDNIAAAIKTVYDGGVVLDSSAASKMVLHLDVAGHRSSASRLQLEQKLGERKLEVLRLIGQGLTNAEIANQIHISEGTVKNYVSQIFEQLGARDRVQAALIAQQELL